MIFASICLVLPRTSLAQSLKQETDENFFHMSLDELADQPYQVISASRQKQQRSELSVPVTVVTAEDIHYSGLTSIPEILQFTLGIDYFRLDRNRYAVGVRGLHDLTSDRTLTLINGRIADSPLFGGSEYFRYPLLVEDIEQIEVVRGPGGAAWGANAFTGVINIITKKPEEVLGFFGSTTMNEYGDSYTHLRWAEKNDQWNWKFSAGYEDQKSSDRAGAGRYQSTAPALNALIGFGNFQADDFSRNSRFDLEAGYTLSPQTQFSMGIGYAHDEFGGYELAGFFPNGHSLMETIRPYFQVDHEFDDGSTGYIRYSSNYSRTKVPSLTEYTTIEHDLETQLNFKPSDEHSVSIGSNIRITRLNVDTHHSQDLMYRGEPFDEQMAGLFLIDRWTISPDLTFEGQIRGDWYSETQTDWSTRLSLLKSLDPKKNHVLRLSWARAFRAPLTSPRRISTARIPVSPGPGVFGFTLLNPTDLENERTWSIEGGYTGKLADDLEIRLNTYYQRFENLIGFDPVPAPTLTFIPRNIDGANSYGAEFEIEKKIKNATLSAWYAYNEFQRDHNQQNIRAYAPAVHKVGLTGRLTFANACVLNVNYKYANTTPISGNVLGANIPASHRMDLVLAHKIMDHQGELSMGVFDMLNETQGPNYSVGEVTAHETPGRTFFARLQYHF